MSLSKNTAALINILHGRLFSHGMGERTTKFLKGLSWSLAAAMIARVVSGLTSIVAARWMGPKEFGEANLSLAATTWIQIPLFLGLPTALLHYLSKSPQKEKIAWTTVGTYLATFLMLGTLGLGFLFREMWANLLGIPVPYFNLALVWSACFWSFTHLRVLLNAREKFALRSTLEAVYAVLLPIAFYFWIWRGYQSAAYLLGLATPYALLGIFGLFFIGIKLSPSPGFAVHSKKLLVYGSIATVSGVALALFESSTRLIANQSLLIADVGVLSAYQAGSTQMAVFFIGVAAQVFFPIASRTPNKDVLFQKLNRVIWVTLPLQILVFAAGLFIYMKILGHNYPFDNLSWLVFSLAATFSFISGILIWFIASYGWRGLVVNAGIGLISGTANILLCQWAIPRFHILGAGISMIVAYGLWTLLIYTPGLKTWCEEGLAHEPTA